MKDGSEDPETALADDSDCALVWPARKSEQGALAVTEHDARAGRKSRPGEEEAGERTDPAASFANKAYEEVPTATAAAESVQYRRTDS